MAWQAAERDEAGVPDSWGLAFSVTHFINDHWMPFLRAGHVEGEAPLMDATVSTGIGRYFSKNRDLLKWRKQLVYGLMTL